MGMASGRRVHHQSAWRKKGAAGEPHATGANPTDRGKPGTKRHLLTEGQGIPLAVVLSGANRHDMKKLEALLDAKVIARPRPPEEPAPEDNLCLDRGYDYEECRVIARAHGYQPHIPAKASAASPLPPPGHPERHPPRRWVVEVCHAWFNRFRRVLTRWERKDTNYLGMVQLAACLIVYRKLRHARSLSG